MHLSKALYLHGNLTYTHRPSFLGLRQSFLLFKDNLSLWSWPLPKLFQPFPLWWLFALSLKTCSSSSNLGTPSLTSHLPLRVHPLLFTSVHLNYSRNHLLISIHSSSHYNLFFFFFSLLKSIGVANTEAHKDLQMAIFTMSSSGRITWNLLCPWLIPPRLLSLCSPGSLTSLLPCLQVFCCPSLKWWRSLEFLPWATAFLKLFIFPRSPHLFCGLSLYLCWSLPSLSPAQSYPFSCHLDAL